jgi:hypothetical protein
MPQVKVTLRNVALNDFLLILFHYLMFINYESIYRNKLAMISPIIHNLKKIKIDGEYLCKIVNDHCILCLQETHHHYRA